MRLLSIFTLTILSMAVLLNTAPRPARADELNDVENKLTELKKALAMSQAATTPLESTLSKLNTALQDIKARIELLEREIAKREREVAEGEERLVMVQILLEKRTRSFYRRKNYFNPALFLFGSQGLSGMMTELAYQNRVTAQDKKAILESVLYIKDLEKRKEKLLGEKTRLAAVKAETDKQAVFLDKEITGAKKYQAKLSSEIAQLSARQKDLLARKLASLNLPSSLGAGPLYCTDDRKIDPGFSSGFAFFTFGIPHRVGMNQYGAFGRAKAGQSYRDILKAYYSGIDFNKKDPGQKIKVQGFGEKTLEEYLLGVYEMPSDWPMEALKAQAVAARSYALAYTDNGAKEICATQACQVYKGGNKGGDWEKAVKETEGEVVTHGGQVISAWYASTAGGYTFTSADVGWSDKPWTKRLADAGGDIGSFSDLFARAYDRDSPCFYAAQGFRPEFGKSAWLKSEELADIVNALILAKTDSGTQKHLSQADKPNPDNEETWSADKVKNELKSRGISPYNHVNSAGVDWDKGSGKTTRVNIDGDAGSRSFDGGEFKTFFNLRAPANIQIVGPLYNIERK